VVGALAVAQAARARGAEIVVGGTTWERLAVDPLPGPRRLDELSDLEPLTAAAALARPGTRGPNGVRPAEARMAELLGAPVLLVDPNPGPDAVGDALAGAARHLGCDLVLLVDVGGDVLAHGDEPGLASPLCDAVLLAGAERPAAAGLRVAGAVFGPGCDGELTPDELLARLAEVAAAGGLLGAWGLTPEALAVAEPAAAAIPTEASAQALACARGALGEAEIRGGRRRVPRSPLGAVTFFFDPAAAVASAARAARAVAGARDLNDADARLRAVGITSELAFELEAAARR
jgi:hypothetical protein